MWAKGCGGGGGLDVGVLGLDVVMLGTPLVRDASLRRGGILGWGGGWVVG